MHSGLLITQNNWGAKIGLHCALCVCEDPEGFLACSTLQGYRERGDAREILPLLLLPFFSHRTGPLELSAWRLPWYAEGYFNSQMFNFSYYTGFKHSAVPRESLNEKWFNLFLQAMSKI